MIRNWRSTVSSVVLATAIALTGAVSATEAGACFGGGKRGPGPAWGAPGYGPNNWTQNRWVQPRWPGQRWGGSPPGPNTWNRYGWNQPRMVRPGWPAAPARFSGWAPTPWGAPPWGYRVARVPRWGAAPVAYRPSPGMTRPPYGLRPVWMPGGTFGRPLAFRVPGRTYVPTMMPYAWAQPMPRPAVRPYVVPLRGDPFLHQPRVNPWRAQPYAPPGQAATRRDGAPIRWVKAPNPTGNVWARAPRLSEEKRYPGNPWHAQPARPGWTGPVWNGWPPSR